MTRGFFAVIEGPEGAGKTTLAQSLASACTARGIDAVAVREPGGTPAAEAIRAVLLDPDRPVLPVTELYLMLACRAELVATVIRPALEAGKVVLADRFDLSTLAYQVAGRGLDETVVRSANQLATGGLVPDLTVVLDVPDGLGQERQRAAGKRQDRLDRENEGFHARVNAAYLAAEGPGVRHFDGTLPPDRLFDAVWAVLMAARPETFRPRLG
ncbi:MAG: dTMP kinase [Gemmatimonadota bacterium]